MGGGGFAGAYSTGAQENLRHSTGAQENGGAGSGHVSYIETAAQTTDYKVTVGSGGSGGSGASSASASIITYENATGDHLLIRANAGQDSQHGHGGDGYSGGKSQVFSPKYIKYLSHAAS